MLPDGDLPKVGFDARTLGVRVPVDIPVDERQHVHPNTGGMSVAPRLADLPPHRIPRRLRGLPGLAAAVGSNSLRVWRFGDGEFQSSRVSEKLWLRIDHSHPRHGLIEPDAIMRLSEFSDALAATRPLWEIDEELT